MNIKFSKHAVDALNAAASCARQLGHDHIGAEHVFLSIIAIPSCQAAKRLVALGLSLDELAESMRAMVSGDAPGTMQRGPLPLSARTRKILEMAGLDAGKDNVADTAHLVLAMLREGENAAAQLLFNAGVTAEKFISAGVQGEKPADDKPEDEQPEDGEGDEPSEDSKGRKEGANGKAQKTPTINTYGRDLTELARHGSLDPVIGRSKELKRIVQILSRRTKNNAVLIG